MSSADTKKSQPEAAGAERMRGGVTYNPRVDIQETADELLLRADLPGVAPEDLNIHYENKELTIEGKVRPRQTGVQFLYTEYGIGDFCRVFTIGEIINAEKIAAEMKNGVLTVHLPKTDALKPRRIQVKAEV